MPTSIVLGFLMAVSLAQAIADDDSLCETARATVMQDASEVFLTGRVRSIGEVWRRALPAAVLQRHAQAAADTTSTDAAVRARGVAELTALDREYGGNMVEGGPDSDSRSSFHKRTRKSFGVLKGQPVLFAMEGWYQGRTVSQETIVVIPAATAPHPSPDQVWLRGSFRGSGSRFYTHTGTLAQWVNSKVSPGCAVAVGSSVPPAAVADRDSLIVLPAVVGGSGPAGAPPAAPAR